jgi:hypothetical protein
VAYDIIGDVHGHCDELEALLAKMNYELNEGVWRHPQRTAVFLGDFIDRGPRQRDTLLLVRKMMDEGNALAVMGNHEFNAIAYQMPDPDKPSEHLRRRNTKNRAQHAAFLSEIGEDTPEHAEWVDWFLTLPLWLNLDGVRVVHACWHENVIARTEILLGGRFLTRDCMPEACRRHDQGRSYYGADGSPPNSGSELFLCIETLLKGIEVELPNGHSFRDKDGHVRESARVRWWLDHPATFRRGTFLGSSDAETLPDLALPPEVLPGDVGDSPVFIGHYWLSGDHAPLAERIASVDYSVARNGPLVAYRWNGEKELKKFNFVSSA